MSNPIIYTIKFYLQLRSAHIYIYIELSFNLVLQRSNSILYIYIYMLHDNSSSCFIIWFQSSCNYQCRSLLENARKLAQKKDVANLQELCQEQVIVESNFFDLPSNLYYWISFDFLLYPFKVMVLRTSFSMHD
jgi:hypothetical protein